MNNYPLDNAEKFLDGRSAYDTVEKHANEIMKLNPQASRVWRFHNIISTLKQFFNSFYYILTEPEILVFALMQVALVGIAYLAWTLFLGWIPQEVWDAIGKDESSGGIWLNLALLAWSLLVIIVASLPLGILNGAILASKMLKYQGRKSTFVACLTQAMARAGRLWVFTSIDAWITSNAILDRLPKRNYSRTAFDESLYYAWKFGTLGVLPALMNGQSAAVSAKDSIGLLTHMPLKVFALRGGYSILCWFIGIATYLGAFYWVLFLDSAFFGFNTQQKGVFFIYFIMVFPILLGTLAVNLFLRPMFLISASMLYVEYIEAQGRLINLPEQPVWSQKIFVYFCVLLVLLLGLIIFVDTLGITNWIAIQGHLNISDLKIK